MAGAWLAAPLPPPRARLEPAAGLLAVAAGAAGRSWRSSMRASFAKGCASSAAIVPGTIARPTDVNSRSRTHCTQTPQRPQASPLPHTRGGSGVPRESKGGQAGGRCWRAGRLQRHAEVGRTPYWGTRAAWTAAAQRGGRRRSGRAQAAAPRPAVRLLPRPWCVLVGGCCKRKSASSWALSPALRARMACCAAVSPSGTHLTCQCSQQQHSSCPRFALRPPTMEGKLAAGPGQGHPPALGCRCVRPAAGCLQPHNLNRLLRPARLGCALYPPGCCSLPSAACSAPFRPAAQALSLRQRARPVSRPLAVAAMPCMQGCLPCLPRPRHPSSSCHSW